MCDAAMLYSDIGVYLKHIAALNEIYMHASASPERDIPLTEPADEHSDSISPTSPRV
jgi:hypothetical protein